MYITIKNEKKYFGGRSKQILHGDSMIKIFTTYGKQTYMKFRQDITHLLNLTFIIYLTDYFQVRFSSRNLSYFRVNHQHGLHVQIRRLGSIFLHA